MNFNNTQRAIHLLRAALRRILPISGASTEDFEFAQLAMMETEGFPFKDSDIPLVFESLETTCTIGVQSKPEACDPHE